MEIPAEIPAALADVQDKVVEETLAALGRRDQAAPAISPAERRRDVQRLFELVQRCVHEGQAGPIITPSQQIATDRFLAGVDLAEAQAGFAVLEDVLWRHLAGTVSAGQQLAALRLVSVILGAGRDALAQAYVSLAGRQGEAAAAGPPATTATPATGTGRRPPTARPAAPGPRATARRGQPRGGCRGAHGSPRPGRRHHAG